ncbi:MAG: RdgB/HAM1 family non-canonical purine NTP pyrophosphatase [Pseudomonadales bacterium]|nr:RdgB/HAM1 family non-canonical purine NTP pyrophosphatase [Pseudomonadales bacterium]
MKNVIIASNNPGKITEFEQLFADQKEISIIGQQHLSVPDIQETGHTFVENALLKARNAARCSGMPAIADDSGIVVDALNGAPGIYSARFGGANTTDQNNYEKLLLAMDDVPADQRSAYYICVIVFLRNPMDPSPLICQGIWRGEILAAPQGDQGFGYDPVFYVPELQCSAAQLTKDQKNQLSHRGQAIRELIPQIKQALAPTAHTTVASSSCCH